jgi:hypothetical protein
VAFSTDDSDSTISAVESAMNTISTDSSSAGATAILAAVEEVSGEDGLSMTAETATTDDDSSDGGDDATTDDDSSDGGDDDDDDDKPGPPLGLILGPIFGVLALAAIAGAYMLSKQNKDKATAKVPTEESGLDDQMNTVGPSGSEM